MRNLKLNLALLNAVIYATLAFVAQINGMNKISVCAVIVCMAFTIPAILKGDL